MVRTVKYSLVLSFLFSIALFTGYSHSATLIIENNTNLTLEIVKERRTILPKYAGAVPALTEQRINISRGYWDIRFVPAVPRSSKGQYPQITKSIIINNDSQVKKIVLVDRDFGKSFIAGPSCDPSMKGKYSKLLKRIFVSEDEDRYGECHDYGLRGNIDYANYQNLPRGFWVYMPPTWYIWGERKAQKATTQKTGGCDTTMGGKYSDKLRTVSVPDDEDQYGKCKDYGWWSGTEYEGHKNLPPGYWVYDAPNWVIYKTKK